MQCPFVKGRQSTLGDVVALCANLVTQAFFLIKNNHNTQNIPLIACFLTQTADLLVSAKFQRWHEKNECRCPWLPHCYITFIHSACSVLGELANDYNLKDIIKAGQPLPATAYGQVIIIMGDVYMMLKAGVHTNTIAAFILSPPSHSFFEESILSNQHNSALRLSDFHIRG